MKISLILILLFFISCSEKFDSKYLGKASCFTQFESKKRIYNNEVVTFDICVFSKGMIKSITIDTTQTNTIDSILIKKAILEVGRYFYPIPSHDSLYPKRCGKIIVKFKAK
jgi:hypothetical protein